MIRYGILKTACLLAATFLVTACTDDVADVPPGKYPMTFATALEGLTQTRATTDNTWTGNERIAVQVGGKVKLYKPTGGNPATLTGKDAANTFYWRTANETKKVSAWYSGAEYTAQLSSFSVKTDQSTDEGYRQSDFLYAKPQDISFSGRNSTTLTFEHLPAKVVVHLKYGDGLTADEVAGATVRIVSQATTSGAINAADGTVEQATTPVSAEIIPGTVTPKAGYQQSVQALLVPRQMQSNKFIKVTIGTGDDARDYYYTPTAATDANLENGKQYTYEITVTKTGLNVASVTIGGWTDSAIDGTVVDKATFRVKLTGGPLPAHTTLDGIQATTAGKVYETTAGNSFSFSYTTSNRAEVPVFTIEKGMATGTWMETPNDIDKTTTYTYTCTNIRSDLWINHLAAGYYYYADGTWSSEYTAGEPACIGIVFWVGDATEKDKTTLKKDHPDCTHGLVVALKDATEGIAWQDPESSVQSWLDIHQRREYLSVESGNGSGAPVNNIQGYNNTKAIEEFNAANRGNIVEAVVKAAEYRHATPAPANSSKWYLPSEKELALLCGGDVDDIAGSYVGTANRDLINGKLSSISGDATQIQSAGYWSSTEYSYSSSYAFYVDFGNGRVGDSYKDDAYRVRCVLAF